MKLKTLIAILVTVVLGGCAGGGAEIEDDPAESFAYHYNLGLAAMERQNWNVAIDHFNNSLKLNSRIPRTHNEIGLCHLYLGNYLEAINSFEQAIALDTNMNETHNSLGVAYMRLKKFRQAEQHFNIALASRDYQTKYVPLYNLGVMYVEQKFDETALEKFKQALHEEEKVSLDYRVQINYQIGAIHFRAGRWQESISYFDQVLVLNPRLFDAAMKAGIAAANINNVELAKVMFQRIVNNAPNTEMAVEAQRYLDRLGKK